jgi:hypothetical protein
MPEAAFSPARTPTIEFVDANLHRLEEARRQQSEVRARLAEDRAVLADLRQRHDAAAIVASTELAPVIVADEQLERDVTQRVSRFERTVAQNRTAATHLAAMVADADAEFGPVVAQLQIPNEVLIAAWRRSREISHETRELRASTEDRRFRRVPADPFGDIKAAAEALLARLERVRITHGAQLQTSGRKEMA